MINERLYLPEAEKNIDELKDGLIRNYLLCSCEKQEIPLKSFLSSFEKDVLTKALRIAKGNQKIAAFILGIKPTTLNEKIKKYKILSLKKGTPKEQVSKILELTDFSSL